MVLLLISNGKLLLQNKALTFACHGKVSQILHLYLYLEQEFFLEATGCLQPTTNPQLAAGKKVGLKIFLLDNVIGLVGRRVADFQWVLEELS